MILNMSGEAYEQADNARKYFTACLLAYYQQLWLWSTHRSALADFNIEKPLWLFVGNTVSVEERSEEHTSELQSLMRISYAVFCLKKKIYIVYNIYINPST